MGEGYPGFGTSPIMVAGTNIITKGRGGWRSQKEDLGKGRGGAIGKRGSVGFDEKNKVFLGRK